MRFKKHKLYTGTASRVLPGSGYDTSNLEEVELKAELLASMSLYRTPSGKLILYLIELPGEWDEWTEMRFRPFEISMSEAKTYFPSFLN